MSPSDGPTPGEEAPEGSIETVSRRTAPQETPSHVPHTAAAAVRGVCCGTPPGIKGWGVSGVGVSWDGGGLGCPHCILFCEGTTGVKVLHRRLAHFCLDCTQALTSLRIFDPQGCGNRDKHAKISHHTTLCPRHGMFPGQTGRPTRNFSDTA